ncbi:MULTISPECIES: transporter substrate-binding domain-containing protein [Basfia]|uniref:ArtI protein n=1 Tax=Mannheimia succiniciproducens (strain KCTC 0769BP / MBEL55E) TaxID=221988 RepID=Q65U53_MANSM|nr:MULTISPECIES: transporter substrate-binding domain-containing protein [Basfia]AAU37507.1 ArtI protein [[Mannheimia] succiniciproducens MBEL55E]SEP93779.1 cyclohexadienyl dehydratase [Basfia succiniciproducens]
MKKATLATLIAAMFVTATAQAQTSPDTLTKVLETKELVVCSPGDYKPFSFDNNGKFEGVDNDLMDKLAQSMGAKVTIVKTTWKTLMDDFTANKCDIAVGGISITLERQQKALFTEPYFINGKTPIVRCENVDKYQTVEQINRPEVRIIANPGGSNEKYARNELSNANLTMNAENLTIFQQVIDKKVDVFVSEAAEAIVKAHEHKGVLCAVNPDKPLKPAQNGWLIHNGDYRFKSYVDQFLHLEKMSGNLDKTINKWLPRD